MLHEKKVMLLPGLCFGEHERGWFRFCFTATSLETTLEALERVFPLLNPARVLTL
jgi:aspartate/methionine/tyrosine aminotransferase